MKKVLRNLEEDIGEKKTSKSDALYILREETERVRGEGDEQGKRNLGSEI